ncbi:hypothetical protein [Microbacterium trichothecenolyticum]|uniref:Uncharacterized protein n=1 Tax=Microbacterium trichothecenolyticum TaxID=69370 RepID=A0ABU0TQ77_MICTR|nr:hypothetical protein [Microbacterium trichothecenolyticum]MDQ1121821.1 hypothetical protein [Microbacterium trichothecenolyticum]
MDDGDVKGLEVSRKTVRLLVTEHAAGQPFQFVVLGADAQTEASLLEDMRADERAMLSIFPNANSAWTSGFCPRTVPRCGR